MNHKNVLPSNWSTKNLLIENTTLNEVTKLLEIFNACSYVEKWDKTFKPESEETFIKMISKNLTQVEGTNKIFQIQSFHLKENSEVVGYFHLHYGVKASDIVMISMFVIHPKYQGKHFGTEIIIELIKQIKKLGTYNSILVEAYLKNWPALQFWINVGFKTIIDYVGDKSYAEDTSASLILEKKI